MKLRQVLLASFAAVATSAIVAGAALFPGFPIVGQASYCAGTSTGVGGQVCTNTVPAGPTELTGAELIPGDTQLSGGRQPQTVLIPSAQLAVYAGNVSQSRNLLRGGDISSNPFQRGTSSSVSSQLITNTLAYGPDGIAFIGGATTPVIWSRQTGATDVVAGEFNASLRMQRASGATGTSAVCQVQVLTTNRSLALQGRPFVFSFYALAGGNFSAASSQITVNVATGTGTDESAANFAAGTWTGQANAYNTTTQAITTTWTRYAFAGSIPSTATQVGVKICFTPVGTAGTNDWIETANIQLEGVRSANVTNPSTFEHQTAQQALIDAQAFFWSINESAGVTSSICTATGLATQICTWPTPVEMRSAPTVSSVSAGQWLALVAGSGSPWLTPTATVSTINAVNLTSANNQNGGPNIFRPMTIQGQTTAGFIWASSEL